MTRTRAFWVLLVIVALSIQTSLAKIYKWKDANGKTHFGERPPKNTNVDEIKAPANSNFNAESSIEITIYTTSWCGYCKKAKAYFAANNMAYKEYDIEKNRYAKRQYDSINGKGVPVILVGDQRLNGFSEKGFERIYKLAK